MEYRVCKVLGVYRIGTGRSVLCRIWSGLYYVFRIC